MPRYFFHVSGAQNLPDLEGTILDNVDEARIQAVGLTGQLMSSAPSAFGDGTQWLLEVTDDQGLLLFLLSFVLTSISGG